MTIEERNAHLNALLKKSKGMTQQEINMRVSTLSAIYRGFKKSNGANHEETMAHVKEVAPESWLR